MAAVYSLNAFLILPIGSMLANDVIYSDSILTVLLQYISEIAEVCAVSVCYAFMLVTLYNNGKTGRVFVIFGCITAYKYIANTAVSWIISGSVPETWVWDIVNVAYFTALELLQLYIIFLFVRSIIGRYTDERLVAQRVFEKTGETVNCEKAYPFKRHYDKNNCLLRSAYVCALVAFIAKLFGEVTNDILYIAAWGFPSEWQTWLYMPINYASRALFGVITYLTVYTAMNSMLKKQK